MHGLMQNMPLMITSLIRHADRNHGDTEIVSRETTGGIHRYTYRDAHRRSRQLARALLSLGVKPADRVATLAWNNYRHFELYYGVSGMGAILNTVNPRLFPEQIAYIINHADDGYVFFDLTFLPLVEGVAPHCKGVKAWVALTDRAHMPESKLDLLCYEELVNAHSDDYEWPEFDEHTASSLCYTSGTTGNPKGVLYSHRSTVLHAYGSALPDGLNLSARDTVLPVVPMFHVNAWGLPYACALTGAKLVMPGPQLDGASLHELFEAEKVTVSAGVPTIWLGLLQHLQGKGLKLSTVKRLVIGGSAAPPAMIRSLRRAVRHHRAARLGHDRDEPARHGQHAQGQAPRSVRRRARQVAPEPGPPHLRRGHEDRRRRGQGTAARRQGLRRPAGARAVDRLRLLQGRGRQRPARGRLVPHRRRRHARRRRLHADHRPLQGRHQVGRRMDQLDRPGEHRRRPSRRRRGGGDRRGAPEVGRAAAADRRQEGRPEVTREQLLDFMRDKIAKWWLPDDVVFVDSLPHTATGKLLKTKLREEFGSHKLPG